MNVWEMSFAVGVAWCKSSDKATWFITTMMVKETSVSVLMLCSCFFPPRVPSHFLLGMEDSRGGEFWDAFFVSTLLCSLQANSWPSLFAFWQNFIAHCSSPVFSKLQLDDRPIDLSGANFCIPVSNLTMTKSTAVSAQTEVTGVTDQPRCDFTFTVDLFHQ